MKEHVLARLTEAKDLFTLEKIIRGLCEPFGTVKNIDLLPDAAPGYIVCRLELDSTRNYAAILNELGGAYVGKSIYFNIPMPGQDRQP